MTKKTTRLLSVILTVLMIVSLFVTAIPVSAEGEPIEITPNTDFLYNDVKIRFDVVEGHTDSFARILPNGTIEFQIANGDMLWFPDVRIGETSKIVATLTPVETLPAFTGLAYSVKPNEDGRWNTGMASVLKTAGRRRITPISYANLSPSPSSGDNGNGGDSPRAVDQNFSNAEKAAGSAWANISFNNNQWAADKTLSFVVDRNGKQGECIWTSPEYGMLTSSTYEINETFPWDGAVGFTVVWQNHGEKHHLILNAMSVIRPSAGANDNGNFYFGDATKEAEYCGLPVVRVEGVAQKLPYTMAAGTEVTVNGVKLRYDCYEGNASASNGVTFNADGTMTAKLRPGDLLWMPEVTVDAASTIHYELKLTGTNVGSPDENSEKHGFGAVWDINATDGVWGAKANNQADNYTIAAFRSNNGSPTDAYLSLGNITSQRARGDGTTGDAMWIVDPNYAECAGWVDVKAAKNGAFGTFLDRNDGSFGEGFCGEISFADEKITAKAADVDGLQVAVAEYADAAGTAHTKGAVGFAVCHSKWNSAYYYTFSDFSVKNAVDGEGHKDVSLLGNKNRTEIVENSATILVDTAKVDIETGIAFFTFKFELTDKAPAGAMLVFKKNGETIRTVDPATLTPVNGMYTYDALYLQCEEETDVLTLCLEVEGVLVEGSESTYNYGEDYAKTIGNVEPISEADLNCVALAVNFAEVEDMTFEPGENVVAGHVFYYVRNSEDGVAEIKDGQLHIKGSKADMILFQDLNLNKTNFRFTSVMAYTNCPTVASWDDPEAEDVLAYQAWNGYLAHLVHVSDADENGVRTGFIQTVTPNSSTVAGVTIDPNAEAGSVIKANRLGEGDAAYDDITTGKLTTRWTHLKPSGVDINYFNGGLGYGADNPMKLHTWVGISGNGYGRLGATAGAAVGEAGKCYTNGAKQSASFTLDSRVGKVGYVCSEDEVDVLINSFEIKVKSTSNMTVDGEQFPIYGNNEISVASLAKNGKQVVYAMQGDEILLPAFKFIPNRLTVLTTRQVSITARKATAVAQTGLKWKFEVDKASYDALLADENVKSVAVKMLIIPTSFAKLGVNRAAAIAAGDAAQDITITDSKLEDLDIYEFNGIRNVAKEERRTSFSAVGYLQITLQDDSVVELFPEFNVTKHAFALADLVNKFDDEKQEEQTEARTEAPEVTTEAPEVTTEAPKTEEKGCKSSVSGFAVLAVVALAGVCFKKKH